jgi:hypothetical protein
MARLNVDLTADEYKELRLNVIEEGITISQYVKDRILKKPLVFNTTTPKIIKEKPKKDHAAFLR